MPHSEETKQKISIAAKRRFKDPAARIKYSLGAKRRFSNPVERQRISVARKAFALKQRAGKTEEQLFLQKINKTSTCWLWTGPFDWDGYGLFSFSGHVIRAHRYAWNLLKGSIPGGLQVLHNCPGGDNPSCVNPDHLWLGTNKQNHADKKAKGRAASGERNGNSKLSKQDVLTMRALHRRAIVQSYVQLAKRFGISAVMARDIIHRRFWKNI